MNIAGPVYLDIGVFDAKFFLQIQIKTKNFSATFEADCVKNVKIIQGFVFAFGPKNIRHLLLFGSLVCWLARSALQSTPFPVRLATLARISLKSRLRSYLPLNAVRELR